MLVGRRRQSLPKPEAAQSKSEAPASEKLTQVNLAETVGDQAAAQAVASKCFGPQAAQEVTLRPVLTLHDPRSFIQIRVMFGKCQAGCFLLCQRGKGPDFILRRWVDLDLVVSPRGCIILCFRMGALLSKQAELLLQIKDVEGLFDRWYYNTVLAEHRTQVQAWVREAEQALSAPIGIGFQRPFACWEETTWLASWTQGLARSGASTGAARSSYPRVPCHAHRSGRYRYGRDPPVSEEEEEEEREEYDEDGDYEEAEAY